MNSWRMRQLWGNDDVCTLSVNMCNHANICMILRMSALRNAPCLCTHMDVNVDVHDTLTSAETSTVEMPWSPHTTRMSIHLLSGLVRYTLALSAATSLVDSVCVSQSLELLIPLVTCNIQLQQSRLTNKENLTRCADRALETAMNIKTRSKKPARLGNVSR